MVNGVPGKLDEERKEKFLTVLRATCNVTQAAQAIGVGRRYVYHVRRRDRKFAALWDETMEEAVDLLEAEAKRRAADGVIEPVFQGGKKVGEVRRFSDRLIEVLLRAHRPEKFKDNQEITHKGAASLPAELAKGKARLEKLRAHRAAPAMKGPMQVAQTVPPLRTH